MRMVYKMRFNIDMEFVFMLFAIMIALIIILSVFLVIINKKRDKMDSAQPERREWARVIDRPQAGTQNGIVLEIYMMFELQDGQRLRLRAKPNNSLVVGDTGYLTWQGTKVKNFERDKR